MNRSPNSYMFIPDNKEAITFAEPGLTGFTAAPETRAGTSVTEDPVLPQEEHADIIRNETRWKKLASRLLLVFGGMILLFFLFPYVGLPPFSSILHSVQSELDIAFLLYFMTGFIAQLVDGAVGMGYGVTSTSLLMGMGVPPAAISGSVHTAEIFSSAASGYSHYKFGNVNRRLFRALVVPGVLGAIAGAAILVWLGNNYGNMIRPFLAFYCGILGIRILWQSWRKRSRSTKVKKAGWLAGAGGFLDSVGGGGWGPLVTSTLIAKGRSPQYVIGSVSLSEFFVTLASAVSFFTFIGITHWQVIAGLMAGGALAAPLAARLAGRLPVKIMLRCVGIMVVTWSTIILVRFFA